MYLGGEREQEAQYWMHEAGKVAERALCLRDKCGSVIVKDGRIIGAGYNAPPLDRIADRLCDRRFALPKPKFDKTCCMHAEWRAVMDALRRNPDALPGSDLYFTRVDARGALKRSGQPYCTVCSRFALDAGVRTFALWQQEGIRAYPTAEYNTLSYDYPVFAAEFSP